MGDLRVFSDSLEHRTSRYPLAEIRHLGWHCARSSSLFADTQRMTLTIHLDGLDEPLAVSNRGLFFPSRRLQAAHAHLAKATFQQRLDRYIHELERRGHFSYMGAKFRSDAWLEVDGKLVRFADVAIDEFYISVKTCRSSQPVNIPTTLDGDIIVALLRVIHERSQSRTPTSHHPKRPEWRPGNTEPTPRAPVEEDDPETRHAATLRLPDSASLADVKKQYRALVAQYHPDKVRHLGVELRDFAEKKTRDLNEAYEYFRRKHGA